MTNGHAYARALRAHSLSQAAIGHLILENCEENGFLIGSDVVTIRAIHNEVINMSSSEEYFLSKVKSLMTAVSSATITLQERSLTAKLWLQYFKQVSVMHDFVRAERKGDGNPHLFSVQRMLVHLHAAGHIHYAKSAHLYLQNMFKLKTILSDQEFGHFVSHGYFTVRRSDKFWCGVWTDMIIEQVLMRSLMVSGGLTQGRNIFDSVVARWICSTPGNLQVTEAVEVFAEVTGEYSDQHISLSRSWQIRDTSDLKKLIVWLKQHSPFNKSKEPISLSSGIVAESRVNCDSAEELGEKAVKGMVGKPFTNVTLKRQMQVFTLAAMRNTITIDKDPVVVNP